MIAIGMIVKLYFKDKNQVILHDSAKYLIDKGRQQTQALEKITCRLKSPPVVSKSWLHMF